MPLLKTSGNNTADGYSGGVAVLPNYIEDVFSTYIYKGTGATQNIVNGIDLAGKGGMVWTKDRTQALNHQVVSSATLASWLRTNTTDAYIAQVNQITSFNADGYTLGADATYGNCNFYTSDSYASWTFRKQPKFFDAVTYTGNGTLQNIAHNLGSVPGCIIVKQTDDVRDWAVYHRSTGATDVMYLNLTSATSANNTSWNDTTPTSTQFTVGNAGGASSSTNRNGATYVAYLFAHNAGGFGLTGTDNVISCGGFTCDGSGAASINLGYEPQYILVKRTNTTGDWAILDTMRGLYAPSQVPKELDANTSSAETNGFNWYINSTGFTIDSVGASNQFIYIAIRKGPMKVPTDATKVFAPVAVSPSGAAYSVNAGFPIDMSTIFGRINGYPTVNYKWYADRVRGTDLTLTSTNTSSDYSISGLVPGCYIKSDNMTGLVVNDTNGSWGGGSGQSIVSHNFKRAPGFFDVVGLSAADSTSNKAHPHNLGVVPELVICKDRTGSAAYWTVYAAPLGQSSYLCLNRIDAATATTNFWGSSAPTSTNMYFQDTAVWASASGNQGIMYLFASCPGVSKVGSYTGTGTLTTINCNFAGGARFVLIKRTDTTGYWLAWDTARGMVAGTDPSVSLNAGNAETNANSVYTATTGFQLLASPIADVNTPGGTYIYLAIA